MHQHFNTPYEGGAIRSYYLAQALVAAGKEVTVITGANVASYTFREIDGIRVHYLPVPYQNAFGFGARSRSFLRYVIKSVALSKKLGRFDFCYAISVPLTVGLAAQIIKMRDKLPFFFEVGDLWPDAPVQMGFINNYFLKSVLYWYEKKIYQSAKALVALSPEIKRTLMQKMPEQNVHLIPNMSDCDFYKPEQKDGDLEQKFNCKQKFVVSYIGAIGVANGLDYLLSVANASRKAQLPIQFFVCGEGALKSRLQQSAKHLNLSNLTFLDFTNRDGVRELLNVTDAAFISYKPVPILETGSPNKYFDALAAGKLIIVNFGGWIKNEIERERCGFYVPADSPTEFVKKIKPFLDDPNLCKQYQQASRNLAERLYSKAQLTSYFTKLF